MSSMKAMKNEETKMEPSAIRHTRRNQLAPGLRLPVDSNVSQKFLHQASAMQTKKHKNHVIKIENKPKKKKRSPRYPS